MASALIKKIEEDFLSCCICFDEMNDPIGLPCLHGFCFKCLDDWSKASQDKTHLTCPACTLPALIPQEGVRGFPSHFLAKNLKDTVHMQFKVEKVTEPRYSTCIVCGNKPRVHCIDCKKSLCKSCHTNHDTFTKDHVVVTIEQLQSGDITHAHEGRFCTIHEEQLKYYCETEQKSICQDCVTLNTCHISHQRVTIKEAAAKQVSDIDDLVKKCNVTKKQMQENIQGAKKIAKDLNQAKKQAIGELDGVKKEHIRRVEEVIKNRKDEVTRLEKDRLKEIRDQMKTLMLNMDRIEDACSKGLDAIKSESDYKITHHYQSLHKKLSSLSQLKVDIVEDSLGYLKFEAPITPGIPLSVGHITQRKHWRCCGQFSTLQLSKLHGVTINQEGYLAVSSWEKCVKLFTKTGHVRCSISDSEGVVDIGVTPDNRFVFSAHDQECIQFRDSRGNSLSKAAILDINDKASFVNSVAVDSKGRIIVGQINNTISIHHADGSQISKFATKFTPLRLAVTSNNEIVSTFYDKESRKYRGLQKMDYTGGNVMSIPPPGEVNTWVPAYVCCSQRGEIFVVNRIDGDPTGVYRYTTEGVYLDCVTTDVRKPSGIALSKGGVELFVAEYDGGIKMFVRE